MPPDVAAAFAHADVPVATRRGLRPSQRFECDIEYGPFDPVALDSHLLAVMLLDAKPLPGGGVRLELAGEPFFYRHLRARPGLFCRSLEAHDPRLAQCVRFFEKALFAKEDLDADEGEEHRRVVRFFLGFVVRALYDVQYKLVTSRGVVPRSSGFLAFEDGLSRATGWRG